jgi:hypothetical protein
MYEAGITHGGFGSEFWPVFKFKFHDHPNSGQFQVPIHTSKEALTEIAQINRVELTVMHHACAILRDDADR